MTYTDVPQAGPAGVGRQKHRVIAKAFSGASSTVANNGLTRGQIIRFMEWQLVRKQRVKVARKSLMAKIRFVIAGAVIAVGMSLSSAQAAPIGPQGVLAAGGSLVEKTHGWHHYCAWGPVRYHRHVRGYGNVPCYRGPAPRCRGWRHECASRWGWGGWRFRRCLERHGCDG